MSDIHILGNYKISLAAMAAISKSCHDYVCFRIWDRGRGKFYSLTLALNFLLKVLPKVITSQSYAGFYQVEQLHLDGPK